MLLPSWLYRLRSASSAVRIRNWRRADDRPSKNRVTAVRATIKICEERVLLSGMSFDNAATWNLGTQSSVSGTLATLGDTSAFAVNFSSLDGESFSVGGSRRITLWNELGQLQAYSDTGRLDYDARWARLHANG